MGFILLALGLVLLAEGILYLMAPGLVDRLLLLLRGMSENERRMAGLVAATLGLVLAYLGSGLLGLG